MARFEKSPFQAQREEWVSGVFGNAVKGQDHRSVLHGFDWSKQNETRAKRIHALTEEEIAAELAEREKKDLEGVARRKPILDQMFRAQ